MSEHTREGMGLTIGVDLGDRYSRVCVLDEEGEVCEEGRIATTARRCARGSRRWRPAAS